MIAALALAGGLLLASPPNHVMDQVDVIPPATEATLDRRLAEFENRHNIEIVIATFDSLRGRQLEATAQQIAREWAVGSRTAKRAVFISFWRDDKAVRIDVSDSLRQLSSAKTAEIQDRAMIPFFRQGLIAHGLEAGAAELMTFLAANPYAPEVRRRGTAGRVLGGIGSGGLIVAFLVIRIAMSAAGFGGGFGYRRGWGYRRSSWGSSWGSSRGSWGGGGFGRSGGGGGFSGRGSSGRW